MKKGGVQPCIQTMMGFVYNVVNKFSVLIIQSTLNPLWWCFCLFIFFVFILFKVLKLLYVWCSKRTLFFTFSYSFHDSLLPLIPLSPYLPQCVKHAVVTQFLGGGCHPLPTDTGLMEGLPANETAKVPISMYDHTSKHPSYFLWL